MGQDGAWTNAICGKVMGDLIETFRKYPNIPTIQGGTTLGSEIPEFVRHNILVGEYPEVHPAIKALRLEGAESVGSRALR